MEPSTPSPITTLLAKSRAGDTSAAGELFERLYAQLRSDAHAILKDVALTIQPTALVHEAWLRLVPGREPAFQDRVHFTRVAARAMRSVLVDHARSRQAEKRGGDRSRVDFDALLSIYEDRAVDLLELDDALERLGQLDEQLARVVELRFFAGLEIDEVASALEVSSSTVDRAWRTARTWLRCELEAAE